MEAFEAACRRLYERGLYRFIFAEAEFLLDLSLVHDEAEKEPSAPPIAALTRLEREAMTRTVVHETIGSLGTEAELLFGVARRVRRTPRSLRCRLAAAERDLTSDNSYRYYAQAHAPNMVDALARTLFQLEQRSARQRASSGAPADPLAVEWLRRHSHYSRIWTALWALQADIVAFLGASSPQATRRSDNFAVSSLYWWAMYWIALARFNEECDGLWILGDSDAAQQAADAVYEIGVLPEYLVTARDQSWLRDFARSIPNHELDRFAVQLGHDPRGGHILGRWQEWLEDCQCAESPRADCAVHLVLSQCAMYTKLIDKDWYAIVGWYQERPKVVDALARYRYLRNLFGESRLAKGF